MTAPCNPSTLLLLLVSMAMAGSTASAAGTDVTAATAAATDDVSEPPIGSQTPDPRTTEPAPVQEQALGDPPVDSVLLTREWNPQSDLPTPVTGVATPDIQNDCATEDCLTAVPKPVDEPGKKKKPGPVVYIGKPAQRAIAESHDWAENPTALPERDALGRVIFTFGESAPTLVCAPIHVCDIELQAGERVQGAPHIGDSVRWKIAPAVSGSDEQKVLHLIVKPTAPGLDTNLLIPTNRRIYHLRLVSSNSHYVTSVAFDYPEDDPQLWQNWRPQSGKTSAKPMGPVNPGNAADDLPEIAVERLNFNYRIKVAKGKPTFKPEHAMDDGYHTYITMNEDMPQREAPVLIGINADGQDQMINYRLKSNMYVIDGTFTKIALLSGVGRRQQRIELTRLPCNRQGPLAMCWDIP